MRLIRLCEDRVINTRTPCIADDANHGQPWRIVARIPKLESLPQGIVIGPNAFVPLSR